MTTPYTIAALKADIASGGIASAIAALVAVRNDAAVAAAYNAITGAYAAVVKISPLWVLEWATQTGVLPRIQAAAAAATTGDAPNPAYIACIGQVLSWPGGWDSPFDLTDPAIAGPEGLLALLASTTVPIFGGTPTILVPNAAQGQPIASGSPNDLIVNWGTVPCSYAESTWTHPVEVDARGNVTRGTVVSVADVSAALNS